MALGWDQVRDLPLAQAWRLPVLHHADLPSASHCGHIPYKRLLRSTLIEKLIYSRGQEREKKISESEGHTAVCHTAT